MLLVVLVEFLPVEKLSHHDWGLVTRCRNVASVGFGGGLGFMGLYCCVAKRKSMRCLI